MTEEYKQGTEICFFDTAFKMMNSGEQKNIEPQAKKNTPQKGKKKKKKQEEEDRKQWKFPAL